MRTFLGEHINHGRVCWIGMNYAVSERHKYIQKLHSLVGAYKPAAYIQDGQRIQG